MRWTARAVCLAAAISIAAAAVAEAVAAGQTSCQPGAGPIASDPSAAGGVNIHVTANNSIIWCSAQSIEANSDIPNGTNYPVRQTTSSPSDNPVSNAVSVAGLLTLAGINPASVNHTQIVRLSGSWSMLDNADLVDPSARFQDGLKPIFWINGSETQYARPLRGPSDTNGDDQIVASAGPPLDLYVYSGPLLSVTATATPNHVAVKQPVTLTAHVTGPAAPNGTLTYTWSFQDGSTATGARVTHSYTVTGTWYPVVTVWGHRNDSGGASPPIPVTVGSVPKGGNGGKPGGAKPAKHAGGPKHSGGSAPNTTPSQKHTSGSTTTHTSGSNQSPAGSGHARPKAATPTAPAASTHHAIRSRHPPTEKAPAQPPRSAATNTVTGRLIADVIPVSAAQLAQQNDTAGGRLGRASAPSAGLGGGSITPLAGIAAAALILGLLGSGAGVELRSQRRSATPARIA